MAKVSSRTRTRVLKAMRELDYAPNTLARSLARGESKVIAHFVYDLRNPFFPAIAKGVEDAAIGKGYNVILCSTQGDAERELHYVQMAIEKQVDGIVFSTVVNRELLEIVDRKKIPIVILEWPVNYKQFDLVKVDNAGGIYQAVEHLVALGHERIALVSYASGSVIANDRYEGYRRGITRHNLRFDEGFIRIYHTDRQNEREIISELWQFAQPPTAIVAASDLIAIKLIQALGESGIRVPEDVSVVGYDDVVADLAIPPLTTIAQPVYEMGSTAIELLLARVQNPDVPPTCITLVTKLVERHSTARCTTGYMPNRGSTLQK